MVDFLVRSFFTFLGERACTVTANRDTAHVNVASDSKVFSWMADSITTNSPTPPVAGALSGSPLYTETNTAWVCQSNSNRAKTPSLHYNTPNSNSCADPTNLSRPHGPGRRNINPLSSPARLFYSLAF